MYSCNPDRRSSFDKFNYFSVRATRPRPAVHARERWPCAVPTSRRPCNGPFAEAMWVAPTSVAFRLHPQARFSNGDPGARRRRQAQLECLAGRWRCRTGLTRRRRRRRRGGGTRAHDPLPAEANVPATPVFNLGTCLGVLAQVGGGKPFDQIVDEPPIAERPYTIASHRGGRRIEFRRNPGTGRATCRCGAASSTSTAWSSATTRTRTSRSRPSRPASSTSSAYRARVFARQHRGRRWDSGDIVRPSCPPRRGGAAVLRAQPAPAAVPGHPGAPGAGADLELRVQQPLRRLPGRPTACSTTRASPPKAPSARGAGAAGALPRPAAAGGVRSPYRARAHRRRPQRPAPQPAEGARALMAAAGWTAAPTA